MSEGHSVSGFGLDYEARIGRARASEISVEPPRPGYERTVAFGAPDRRQRLLLQNCGGTFVLASSTTPVVLWSEVFGAEWERYSLAAQRLEQYKLEKAVLGQLEHFFDIGQVEIDLSKLATYVPRYEWDSRNCDLDALTSAAMAYGRDHELPRWSAFAVEPRRQRE